MGEDIIPGANEYYIRFECKPRYQKMRVDLPDDEEDMIDWDNFQVIKK
jgi:hypothetical protein